MITKDDWPKISIVTPSFNQGRFLEATIKSVLDQGYPNLEYVIIDGGSTDNSVEIIREYEKQLTYWVSEPDGGQYDAINRGFAKTSGDIMAWLNSDDKYTPWALAIVAEIFATLPAVEWLTTSCGLLWDSSGRAVECHRQPGYSSRAFLRGANFPGRGWYSQGWIQQESTFWRRSLWERAGSSLDASLKMAGDFDLWARFARLADLYAVATPLGGFRVHGDQKTAHEMEVYLEEAEISFRRHGGRPYGRVESAFRHLLSCGLGHQAIIPGKLPPPAGALISRLPFFYPTKLCTWSPKGWQLVDGYMV